MARALAAAMLAGLVACDDGAPPAAPKAAAPPAQVRSKLGSPIPPPPASTVCAAVVPESAAPGWLVQPLVVGPSAPTATAQLSGPPGPALITLQNGDGLGQGGVAAAQVALNGAGGVSVGPGVALAAQLAVLGAGDTLLVSATGAAGSARASVASLSALPCPLAGVTLVRKAGPPQTKTETFARPDGLALGVIVSMPQPGGSFGTVKLNGNVIFTFNTPKATGPQAAVVSLGGSNTVEVHVTGKPGSSIQVSVLDVDTTAPSLSLNQPADGAFFNVSPITASGTTGADATAVNVSGVPATLQGGAYTASVPLQQGSDNAILAASRDFCGNVARRCHAVTFDTAGPVIAVSGVVNGQLGNSPVTPVFTVTDPNLQSMSATLDGVSFASGTTVGSEGEHTLVIDAMDLAGNPAHTEVLFTIDLTLPVIVVSGVVDGQLGNSSVTPVFSATDLHPGSVSAKLDGIA
ncbi:MAG: hypothetical protein ACYC8T_36195, partial [Myxococcaceae bacterium]